MPNRAGNCWCPRSRQHSPPNAGRDEADGFRSTAFSHPLSTGYKARLHAMTQSPRLGPDCQPARAFETVLERSKRLRAYATPEWANSAFAPRRLVCVALGRSETHLSGWRRRAPSRLRTVNPSRFKRWSATWVAFRTLDGSPGPRSARASGRSTRPEPAANHGPVSRQTGFAAALIERLAAAPDPAKRVGGAARSTAASPRWSGVRRARNALSFQAPNPAPGSTHSASWTATTSS